MPAPREPVFLARETYRRRRLIDAVRLLPIAGLLMFFAPLVGGAGTTRSTALAGIYVFSVWFALLFATWGLVRFLARAPEGVGSDPLDPERTGGPPSEPGTTEEPPAAPDPTPAS